MITAQVFLTHWKQTYGPGRTVLSCQARQNLLTFLVFFDALFTLCFFQFHFQAQKFLPIKLKCFIQISFCREVYIAKLPVAQRDNNFQYPTNTLELATKPSQQGMLVSKEGAKESIIYEMEMLALVKTFYRNMLWNFNTKMTTGGLDWQVKLDFTSYASPG